MVRYPKPIKAKQDSISNYYEHKNSSLSQNELNELIAQMNAFYELNTEYYRFYGTKRKTLKGVRLFTDNDLFAIIDNRDHEYSGGFRLEFITDYFGLKLFSFRKEHNFLDYQSVLFGFELYTPNELNVKSISEMDIRDRPFASFQYLGRSRHFIKYDGSYRSSETIKIGLIGGTIARNFQRILHRELSDSSHNNGWDFQIANGGKLAIQYDLRHEWQQKFKKKNLYFNYGFESKLGFEKLSIAPSLTLTNKSFFEKNPALCDQQYSSTFRNSKMGSTVYAITVF